MSRIKTERLIVLYAEKGQTPMHRTSLKSFITPNLWSIIAIALVFTSTIAARSNASPTLFPSATTTTISYQGTLSNAGGQPVNGATPMTFKLYTAPSGGTALWTEARAGANSVPINNGLFNVLLGSVTPIDVNLLSQDLWLGISVNSDAEMSPREKLGSVPFAAMAGTVPDGSITSDKLRPTIGHSYLTTEQMVNTTTQWTAVTVPETTITLHLTENSRVMVWFFASAHSDLRAQRDVLLQVDQQMEAVSSTTSSGFFNFNGMTVVELDPGTHTIHLAIQSSESNESLLLPGGRTAIMYQVVSQ